MHQQSRDQVPLWLDCDPGHDDAFAILLALYHPSLNLLGLSTVHGNAPLTETTDNALSILEAIGRPDIAVYPGASKPFCREVVHAVDIHGESGLDGTDLLPKPKRHPLNHCNAIREMRDALMDCAPNTAWLVTTGTLTNAALLFATHPEVANHIAGLSIMGGAVGNGFTSVPMGPPFKDDLGREQPRIGNYTPYAEFNIWCDPESAQSVLQNPVLRAKTTLVPLDLTHQAFVNKDIQNLLLTPRDESSSPTRLRRMFNELLMFFAQTYANVFGLLEGPPLHDPLAVAILLSLQENSSLKVAFDDGQGERWDVDVVLGGDQIGRTVLKPSSDGRGVTIPRSLDLQSFWRTLDDCLAGADAATGYVR